MPTTTDTYTCLTCTGCDPHGCGGQTCVRTCRLIYAWSPSDECPVDCNCPAPTGPCDADHLGTSQTQNCQLGVSGPCVPGEVHDCHYLCVVTGAGWVETTPCPSGCLCTETLATCDTGHAGDTDTQDCAEPTWA